ncbi:DUF5753 domain-containing protein [Streptomyces sp. HNM0663]|uniref:DUF5753 domain-containing protein n=1 Tax=Streptomyces chengmaiensis TaxID=3040919 RepID=A0ABT6HNZ5_9ACTN|nr:DUF5753 domain-containing protein [Streptomyces chengmaiensis]MDH2390432.1 DUF5753 domain-containing protein [Streptomyces chengmaiensis]
MRTEELIGLLRAPDQSGQGRVEQTAYGGPNIERLAALDAHASSLRSYSLLTVPGLLQDPEYGMHVIRAALPRLPDHELRRRVLMKSARAVSFLERARRGEVRAAFVLGEQSLAHAPGLDAVEAHRKQLRRLLAMTDIHSLSVQILPFHTVPPQFASQFSLWAFAKEPDREAELARKAVGYCESIMGGSYSTRLDDMATMHSTFADLVSLAWPPSRSRSHIAELLGEAT